jgi:ATP-dependent DNA helicase PIF1
MNWQEKYAPVIDEVSMLGARTLYAVNGQLRRLRESTEDFGDIPVIICCGDFYQFRPVQERSTLLPSSSFPWGEGHGFSPEQQRQHDVAQALWRTFTVAMLKEQIRAAQDPRLRRLLTLVRQGD